jgi:outer membrane protein TolC
MCVIGLKRCRSLHGWILATGLLAQTALVSPVRAQSLDQALDLSLRSSISLQSDNARQDVSVARLRGSIDAFMPTVSFVQERILTSKITYSPEITVPTTLGGDSTARSDPNLFAFQASLPLFDGFKRYNNFRSASLGVESGKFLQLEKRQQVLLDTATAYLAILRDRKIVDLRRRQVGDIATIADRTKARFSVRDATLTDVDLANSRLLASQVALDQAMSDLTASNIEFTRLTGVEPTTLAEPRVPIDLIPETADDLRACLLQSNPRIRAARLDATAAGYLAKSQVSDLLPQVNLVALHGRQSNISEALQSATNSTIKVQVRVPIYEPGTFAKIGESNAIARQKSWDALDSEKQSTAAITSLFYTRLSTLTQIGRATARVGAMQKAVKGYQIEQSAGFRTIIDILNARNELTEAQVARVALEFNRDKLTFTLAAALARLGPSHVTTVAALN